MTWPLSLFPFQMVTRTKKIFVGGLSAQSTLEDVKNYFEQFGKVRKTGRRGKWKDGTFLIGPRRGGYWLSDSKSRLS